MKTFKNKPRSTGIALSLIILTVILNSCTKGTNNNDVPPAHVMVVNAVKGSAAQTLKLNNNTVNATAVAYGQSSDYVTELPGNDNAQFFDSGTAKLNASSSITLTANAYFTVYYAGNDTTKAALTTLDNAAVPTSGYSSVQFINFSASTLDFGVISASKLATGLAKNSASGYYSVAANASFGVYAAGSLTSLLTVPALANGKIYTIYVTGSSTASLSTHVVIHNLPQ